MSSRRVRPVMGASGDPDEFDPEAPESREVAGEAATDRDEFLSLMAHLYRGEMGRANAWRARLDRTTNWAVVLAATLLTWAFSSNDNPHYVVLVGIVMVSVFLGVEARRYRMFDAWRSRVRLLEEDVFANALDPEGAEHAEWREWLSEDLRDPAFKVSGVEAVTRRLRRMYAPLYLVLLLAWLVRVTAFAPEGVSLLDAAAVGRVPGGVVLLAVGLLYGAGAVLLVWPRERRAKGEFSTGANGDWKD